MSGQNPYPQQHSWPAPGQQPNSNRGRLIAIVVASVVGSLVVVAAAVGGFMVLSTDPGPPPSPALPQVASSADAPSPSGSRGAQPVEPSPTADPQKALERNDLYQAAQLKSAGCAQNSQAALDNLGNVRAYYQSVLPCLTKAWGRLSKGDITMRAPKLKVFSGEVSTPCGGGVLYSFYCRTSETIYMYADEVIDPWNQYAGDDFSHGITRLAAVHTIAHEFAHHIQQVTGIFDAMGPNWAGTELERRSELQASCLGNIFLSSQRDAYAVDPVYWDSQWERLWRFITRVPNHGSEANQRTWTAQGYESASPGDCNTWTASAAQVT